MKKSLAHLPKNKREELKTIAGYVLEELSGCEMIILYGCYARGDYVGYDQRNEFGIRTFFMSDYDLLVLINNKVTKATAERVGERFSRGKHYSMVTPIQFIVERVNDFNRAIDKGRYFYTDIKKEGILLYDSGNYKLERRRKLNYSEIRNVFKIKSPCLKIMLCEKLPTFVCGIVSTKLPVRALNVNRTRIDHTSFPRRG